MLTSRQAYEQRSLVHTNVMPEGTLQRDLVSLPLDLRLKARLSLSLMVLSPCSALLVALPAARWLPRLACLLLASLEVLMNLLELASGPLEGGHARQPLPAWLGLCLGQARLLP